MRQPILLFANTELHDKIKKELIVYKVRIWNENAKSSKNQHTRKELYK